MAPPPPPPPPEEPAAVTPSSHGFREEGIKDNRLVLFPRLPVLRLEATKDRARARGAGREPVPAPTAKERALFLVVEMVSSSIPSVQGSDAERGTPRGPRPFAREDENEKPPSLHLENAKEKGGVSLVPLSCLIKQNGPRATESI